MKTYRLGIDGGGTAAQALVAFGDGRTQRFFGGAININGNTEEAVRANLRLLLAKIADAAGPLSRCEAAGIGAAGISNPRTRPFLTELLRECGFDGALRIEGDNLSALYGALGTGYGAILIAGTGSIGYGRNPTREARAGGYGHRIDDEGSAYALSRDAFAAVCRAADGRGEETVLSELLAAKGFSDPSDIVAFLYNPKTDKRAIASYAPMVTLACERRDTVALAIAQRAANGLFELAAALCLKLGTPLELALCGGVLQNCLPVRERFLKLVEAGLPQGVDCITPRADAVTGALLMAAEALTEGEQPAR